VLTNRRRHILSSGAGGADTQTVHGPLQRLLDVRELRDKKTNLILFVEHNVVAPRNDLVCGAFHA